MWSGWAGSRTFQPTGVASKGTFGGFQGGHRPRWSKATARQEKTRRDHRGWSTHTAASRGKSAKPNPAPNGIFVTSGEIGTNAMHPPGKRSIDINNGQRRHNTANRHRYAQRICDHAIHNQIFKPTNAMPGGMWSGCAGSRTFQPTTAANQHIIGVYQGGHRPRWS